MLLRFEFVKSDFIEIVDFLQSWHEKYCKFNITTSFKFRREVWIIDIAFTVILLLISLNFVVAWIYHQTKTEKTCRKIFSQLSLEKRYGVLSRYTCISIAFVSLLQNMNRIGFLAIDGVALFSTEAIQPTVKFDIACHVFERSANFLFGASNGMVYLFLWLRQSIFYVQQHLKVLNKKWVRVFSLNVLIFI